MNYEQIEDLTATLSELLSSMDWMGRSVRPKLRSSASASELEKLTTSLGREVPGSYRTFLKMANGMDGADQFDWMIAGCSSPQKGEKFSSIHDQVLVSLKGAGAETMLATLENAIMVGSDFDSFAIYFDPATLSEDEPSLLKVGLDAPDEKIEEGFKNFEAFLSFVVQIYEETSAFMQTPMDDIELPDLDLGLGDLAPPKRKPRAEDDASLLAELDSLLGGFDFSEEEEEEEEEEELQISPEMQLASDMCKHVIASLIKEELIEVIPGPENLENLEDYMLRKLLRVTREDQILDSWISALSKAREVEELYGTDDELKRIMQRAWDEIAALQE